MRFSRGPIRNSLVQLSRLFALIATALLALSLSGCRWLLSNSGPIPVVVAAESLGLAWDSNESQLPDQPSSVDHYNVYYRPHGTADWRFLHATEDDTAGTTIVSSELDFGSYEFAVEVVYRDGTTSARHGSSDFSAWPTGGWYVVWQAP